MLWELKTITPGSYDVLGDIGPVMFECGHSRWESHPVNLRCVSHVTAKFGTRLV